MTLPAAGAFEEKYRKASARSTQGVSLHVSIAGNARSFHAGQIVPLDLSFTSPIKNAFQLDVRQYDRSGRDNLSDEYIVDRPGDAVDPLKDYFSFGGFFMGGLSAMPPVLTETPVVIHRTLNEWLRFDQPGTYRLYVVSHRATPLPVPKSSVWPASSVVSNMVTFDILPADPQWERAALAACLKAKPEDASLTTLRFLATDDAVQAILRRIKAADGVDSLDDYFGLIGARNRKLVIAGMTDRLADPKYPVTVAFVRSLIKLKAAELVPQLPRSAEGTASRKEWTEWTARYTRAQGLLESDCRNRIRLSMPARTGRVRAVTLKTLLDLAEFDSTPASRNVVLSLSKDLLPVFETLTFAEQDLTLQTQTWSHVRGREWLPVLKRIAQRLSGRSDEPAILLRADVIKRLYELDPATARLDMIRDMQSPEPKLPFEVLKCLPDTTLPILSAALRRDLRSSDYSAAQARLVARYGDGDLLPDVLRALGDGAMTDSDRYPALLAYVLLWDPPYGRNLLRKAVAGQARNATLDYAFLFSTIGEASWSPEAEAGALEALGNPRGAIVRDASDAIMRYGSARCQDALWRRLKAWNETWRNRRAKLQDLQRVNENACRDDVALASALAQATSWALMPADIARLEQLCLNPSAIQVCKTNTEIAGASQGRSGAIPIWADFIGNDDMWSENTWRVGQYTLSTTAAAIQKVRQYPHGTKFVIVQGPLCSTPKAQSDLAALSRAAIASGMKVEML